MAAAEFDRDDDEPIALLDQLALWLEVWTADRPHLRLQAAQLADPNRDRVGYLIALGELVAASD